MAVVARTGYEIEGVAAEIRDLGALGVALVADLTKADQVNAVVASALEQLGKVDVLVNNVGGYRLFTSGLAHHVPFLELEEAEWGRVLASDLTTAFLCCKAVLPPMVAQGRGSIVNLTSANLVRRGVAGQAVYSASKSALERLTESLADEFGESGIAVNSLNPGWVLTRPNDDYDAEIHKRMRLPEDIGEWRCFWPYRLPKR